MSDVAAGIYGNAVLGTGLALLLGGSIALALRRWQPDPAGRVRVLPLAFGEFILLSGLTVFAFVALAAALSLAIGERLAGHPDGALLRLLTIGAALPASLLVAPIVASRLRPAAATRSSRPDRWFSAGLGAAGALAALPIVAGVYHLWAAFLGWFGIPPQPQELVEQFAAIQSDWVRLAAVAFVVLAAPIGEEAFFRGFLYRYLRGVRPGRWAAAAASAALFASAHGNLDSLAPLLVLGLLLCLAYELTGNLATPVAMHATFNLNTAVVLLLGGGPGGT